MKITYTLDRLAGERVIQTVPAIRARVAEEWYSRPHIYKGRALTDKTLNQNARHHIQHLQLFGQHFSAGVIQGLEIAHYHKDTPASDAAAQTETWFRITPGMGLTHKGEDVSLANIAHVALEEVYSVATIEHDDIESESILKRLIVNRFIKTDQRNPKRYYLTLYSRNRDKIKERLEKIEVSNPAPILTAWDKTQVQPRGPGILVLEPIELIDEVNVAEDSQCQWDAEQDPFDDERLIDGCRLVFYPWPDAELDKAPAVNDPHRRNKLAYQIFDYEQAQYQKRGRPRNTPIPVQDSDVLHVHKQYRPYTPLPWEHYGVALALVDVANNGDLRFLDAHATRRKGGAPLSVRPMLAMNGSPFFWEARIQQFVAHMHDLAQNSSSLPAANKRFDVLPPVGLLPRQTLDFKDKSSQFFPSQFIVEAVPIPEEQLEVAMNASASLEPFDVYRPERVKLLVPVPQEVFEPDLLETEQPDPIFLNTIRQLVYQIRLVLAARNGYRGMAARVVGAIDWDDVPVYGPDREATPDEAKFPAILPVIDTEDYSGHATDAIQNLAQWIHENAPMDNDSDYKLLADTGKLGTASFPGLEQIIINFQRKIDRAELYLSTAYVKAEAEIYRLRQVMLGSEKVTRLATSPAVGKIVEGYTRTPTVEDLQSYFTKVAVEETETSRPDNLAAAARVALDGKLPERNISALWADYKRPATIESIRGLSRSKKIIDRVYEAPAAEVKQNSVNTKSAVFGSLAKVLEDIDIGDSEVTVSSANRGVMKSTEYDNSLGELSSEGAKSVLQNRARKSGAFVTILTTPLTADESAGMDAEAKQELESLFSDKRGKNRISLNDPGVAQAIREGVFDPDPKDGDEANYFSVGVEVLEHAFEALQKVDLRIDAYRKAIAQAQRVLQNLRANAVKWRTSLTEQENKLSGLRHDALVARSLFEEERARVTAINRYRLQILEEYVTSLAYVRPRLVEARCDAPSIKLRAEYVNPVPACLAQDFDAADELRDMLDVFREVPVYWFTGAKPLVALLDYPLLIVEVYQHAAQRSQLQADISRPSMNYQAYHANAIGESVNQLVMAHQASTLQYHEQKARFDTEALKQKSWKDLLVKAENDFSLADLIESGKGKSFLARRAAVVMENLEDVAVCLNARCNELTPAIRLRWADEVSVFDRPMDLSHLDVLPSWDELDYLLRRDLQNLVDWLCSQVDSAVPEAQKLMNDLVRVCILLASHAPVNSIIRGYVPKPVKGKVGDIIDVAIDKGLVKVGMVAAVMSQDAVLVQGVVTDIAAGAASIQVNESNNTKGQFSVGNDAQVMFRQASGGRRLGKF